MYDLVLTGGKVLDPELGWFDRRDVAIQGDRIVAVEAYETPLAARRTIDCTGQIVCPGFIDFHVHVFPGVSHFGVDPDETCLARGVTTVLDFGTAGALIYDGFRRYVIDVAKTRVKALMLIAGQGLISSVDTQPALGELWDLAYCDVTGCVRAVERNRDSVVGIKVRCMDNIAADGKHEAEGLRLARQAADATRLPLVVHPVLSSLPIEQILAQLGPGDVLTHCYHEKRGRLVDDQLRVLPAVRDKLAEGLLLDVGHGAGSFSFPVARAMLDQGVLADYIGSDLHRYNLHGPVYDLATTMSKFLHLEMPLAEIVRRVTTNPAKFLGMAGEIGTLRPGACADLTVIDFEDGEFPWTDSEGHVETGTRRIVVRRCVRGGEEIPVRELGSRT